MKYITLALFAFGFASSVQAQQPDKYNDLTEKGRKKSPRDELFISKDTAERKENLISPDALLQKSRYSHSTSRGDVYILPYDNMPCLVPDQSQLSRMPGSRDTMAPQWRMPNATPRYKIPKRKN